MESKVKIKNIVNLINGFPFKSSDRSDTGYNIIRIQNLNNPLAFYNKTDKRVDKKYIVTRGDILISWSASLGVYEWKDEDALLNQHIFKVVFISEDISKSYFRYVIDLAIDELTYKMRGVGLKHLTKGQLDEYEFSLPSLEEQNIITNKLNAVEVLISKRKKTLALLDEYLESCFNNLFGDPIINKQKFPKSKFGELTFQNGYSFKSSDFVGAGIPLLKINEVKDFTIDEDKLSFLPHNYVEKFGDYVVKSGDLILSLTGTYGKDDYGNISMVKSKNYEVFLLNQRVSKLSFDKNKYDKLFLYYLMKNKNVKKLIRSTSKGVRQANLSASTLSSVEFIQPKIQLQLKFSSLCQKVFQHKQKLEKSLQLFEEYFQSLLYNSFTGNKIVFEDNVQKMFDDELEIENLIENLNASDFDTLSQYDISKDLLFEILEKTESKTRIDSLDKTIPTFSRGIVQIVQNGKVKILSNREYKLNNK